ncbi:hypothetical protein D8B23_20625 [Verminephrobacter aporrectodeae subsp. tuberculatae]|uniref:Butirosin biosynthesis protein H N-terminal domain-containing protein n=1 Tax=Verminephrobacter aporrectodeae subsp. tuberculatae TaxID=1110392 RepID=A0ABT3KRS9_9BURK|nr:hypothetical protein [Verminephrobacter aporrectodeae]MCW5321027.1 hypothetical protein [Verminephrobacter aporrectodeae subsp. tuberculatae]MCW8200732.1 hypothetical protein [Verminephrobacter aporrectodeae subsp. tuberculatae]
MIDYEYDKQVYNRNFLNCAQRQSIVVLKDMGYPVDLLFYNAQVETDLFRKHSFVKDIPRFDFLYNGLTDEDFRHVGIVRTETKCDTFQEAKPQLLEYIERDSFVLMSCNLLYIPHRPEYFGKSSVLHFNTLKKYDADTDIWAAIDDQASGVLMHCEFPSSFLKTIYDGGIDRCFRSFQQIEVPHNVDVDRFNSLFTESRKTRSDSFKVLGDLEALTDADIRLTRLANVFALIYGSRLCFAQFPQLRKDSEKAHTLALEISQKAGRLRDLLTISAASGRVNKDKICALGQEIFSNELHLSSLIDN